jgi:hypothetical protein
MLRVIAVIFMFAHGVFAQSSAPAVSASTDAFKKEYRALQRDVDMAIDTSVPGAELLQTAKAAYLEEFGIVVTLEVALERPVANPFSAPRSAAEIRLSLNERRKLLQDKVQSLLKLKAGTLVSLGPGQSVAIVVHLFNPSNVANIPTQIIFIAKKQDPTKVIIREL